MSDDTKDQVHRDLVANLRDEGALDKMQHGWLAADDWGAALERVRAQHFAELPVDEGNRRVGSLLAERFLASNEGQLVRVSLEAVPRQSLFGKLVPMMGQRLRSAIRFEWVPSSGGGRLRILGKRSAPVEVTFGFLQAIVQLMSPPPSIAIETIEPELVIVRVDGL